MRIGFKRSLNALSNPFVTQRAACFLDTPLRLAQPGNPCDLLGRPLGIEGIEFLGVDAGSFADGPQRGRLAGLGIFVTYEIDNNPVLVGQFVDAFFRSQDCGDLRGPFVGVSHESFGVKAYVQI